MSLKYFNRPTVRLLYACGKTFVYMVTHFIEIHVMAIKARKAKMGFLCTIANWVWLSHL